MMAAGRAELGAAGAGDDVGGLMAGAGSGVRGLVVAVVGPTASGKSTLAEDLALELDGEIVSADSMQVYRGMDIGTAKVPPSQRRVLYHCIDVADPGEAYSVALYQEQARGAIRDILSRGKAAVVCGGTGLYVRAALDDMRFPAGERADNPLREHYAEIAERQGAKALHALLAQRDPESAAIIHPNNTRRVIRALELLDEGETTYARQHEGLAHVKEYCPAVYLGIRMERDLLYERINLRVDEMIRVGLALEIEHLASMGFTSALTAPQAIGYKEIAGPVLQGLGPGDAAFDEGIEQIKLATRRYAKRQMTWFRKDSRIAWLDWPKADGSQKASAALLSAAMGEVRRWLEARRD